MLFGNKGAESNTQVGEEQIPLEAEQIIMEAAMMESLDNAEMEEFLNDTTEQKAMAREEIVQEATIVRLDKNARLSRTQAVSVFTIAREKGDRDFKKLSVLWRMEKMLEAKLFKKYGTEAMRRAKTVMRKKVKSPVKLVKKVANDMNKKLHSM